MKVYLSTDMEGTAGIVDWAQCVGDGPEAMAGRELLLAEVNAAIDGALAASSMHPHAARELIQATATEALKSLAGIKAPGLPSPSTLEVSWRTADMAEMATWIRGTERVSARVTRARESNRLELFRMFITIVLLTRGVSADV